MRHPFLAKSPILPIQAEPFQKVQEVQLQGRILRINQRLRL